MKNSRRNRLMEERQNSSAPPMSSYALKQAKARMQAAASTPPRDNSFPSTRDRVANY